MLIYDAEYFDPESTLESGQIFRYKRLDKNDYIVYTLDHKCRVRKVRESVKIDADNDEYFREFFDLYRDYGAINTHLQTFSELSEAAEYGKGIRIMKQGLYECILSFIISANNNIPRIKSIIQRLTRQYGKEQEDYYSFPTLKRLSQITVEEFREVGAGFRDIFLSRASEIMATTNIIERLESSDNEDAFRLLKTLPGVGAKVADCVMLFGLGRLNRFPVDVWMFRACKNEELNTPRRVNAYYTQRYGEYAGIAQQYIFHHARTRRTNNPRKTHAIKI